MAIPPDLACSLLVTFRTRQVAVAEVVPLEKNRSATAPSPLYLTVRVPNPERGQYFTFSMNFGYVIARAQTLRKGSHTVYTHRIRTQDETRNLIYTGITRQGWQKRWTQHQRDARSGSRHLFHRALREHPNAEYMHRVIAAGLTEDYAMRMEEMWADHTLHPKGLNMIPGGYAGLKYLHKLGAIAPRQQVDGPEGASVRKCTLGTVIETVQNMGVVRFGIAQTLCLTRSTMEISCRALVNQ